MKRVGFIFIAIFCLGLLPCVAIGEPPCNQLAHETLAKAVMCVGGGGYGGGNMAGFADSHNRQMMRIFTSYDMVPPQPNLVTPYYPVYSPYIYVGAGVYGRTTYGGYNFYIYYHY